MSERPALTDQQKRVKASRRQWCDRCGGGISSGAGTVMKGGPGRFGYSLICGRCMQEGGIQKKLNPGAGRNGLFGFLTQKQTTYHRDVKGERADLIRAAKAKRAADKAVAKQREAERKKTQRDIQDEYSYKMGARHKRERKPAKPGESFLTAPAAALGREKAHKLASRAYMQGYRQNPAGNPTEWPRVYPTKAAAESAWYDSAPGRNDRARYVKRKDGWHIVEGQDNPIGPVKGMAPEGTTAAIRKLAARLGVSFARAASLFEASGGNVQKAAALHKSTQKQNPAGLFDSIRPGSRVTIADRFGKKTGRAVMRGPAGWVLNLGGKHGTPGIASPENVVAVSKQKRPVSAGQAYIAGRGNPITHVSFTVDKRGRPVAYRIQMPPLGQYQPIRMNLDQAKLLVSTGQAKAVPYRSSAADRRAAEKNPRGYTKAEAALFKLGRDIRSGKSRPALDRAQQYEVSFRDATDYGESKYFSTKSAALKFAAAKRRSKSPVFPEVTVFELEPHRRAINPAGRRKPAGERNPLSAAARLSERFHGRPATEVETVREKVHSHGDLTKLGDLVRIVIDTVTGFKAELNFNTEDPLKIVRLGCSEDGKQLYLRGGDQEVNLKALRMDSPRWIRDRMELGRLHEFPEGEEEGSIVYRTKKKFNNFRVTDWWHKAGEVSSKKIGPAARPTLVYDPRSKLLELVGGRYVVQAPGIID